MKINYGQKNSLVKGILREQNKLGIIEIHKYKEDELMREDEKELYRIKTMLEKWEYNYKR